MLQLKRHPRLVFAYAISAFLLAVFLLMIATAYVFLKIDKMPSKSVVGGSSNMMGAPDMRIINMASDFGHLFDTKKRALVGILFSESVVSSKYVVLPTRSILEEKVAWDIPDYGGLDIGFFEYDNTERTIYRNYDETEWRDPETKASNSWDG
jgi:hypothetical protein